MVPESELVPTEHGLVPKGDGWFVLNARETTEPDEAYARFGRSRLTRYRDGWLSD